MESGGGSPNPPEIHIRTGNGKTCFAERLSLLDFKTVVEYNPGQINVKQGFQVFSARKIAVTRNAETTRKNVDATVKSPPENVVATAKSPPENVIQNRKPVYLTDFNVFYLNTTKTRFRNAKGATVCSTRLAFRAAPPISRSRGLRGAFLP